MFPIRNSEKVLSELEKQAQNKDYRFKRIYRILCNPDMYIKAYSNIYSNEGSATRGADDVTADGFSEDRINRIITTLKDESYVAGAVRRTYIPKKDGKTRPLGIPNFDDRLVQEVCRMILERIYEPTFSKSSHGFRPKRSCHTALTEIVKTFKGVNWFIEGNIKGCFDNIDHQTLVSILRRRIDDERFIRLIWKFLGAGYLENFRYNNTFSGTPQGGIVSPILANIYLSELDAFISGSLKGELTATNAGDRRENKVPNPKYTRLNSKMHNISQKITSHKEDEDGQRDKLIAIYKDLQKQRNKENYCLGLGNYRNLFYVRYADDFIIGVHGSKEDCQNIKTSLCNFLRDTLKLELSEEKTLITNSMEEARFLNYEIRVRENNKFFERKDGLRLRAGNRGITLNMPSDVMLDYINKKGIAKDINAKEWRGKARIHLQDLSDLEIISIYNAEIRGLYNYYALAENVGNRMNMIFHLMEYSCLKTLASKHKTSAKQMRDTLRIGKEWGVRYDTKKEKNKVRLFYNQGFSMKKIPEDDASIDVLPNTAVYAGRTELEQRISAKKCEICGKENAAFHIHHVHKVKDLKGKDAWEKIMIERQRKTLVLCVDCHKAIHSPKDSHTVTPAKL